MPDIKFEDRISEIEHEINKRKHKWTLKQLDFEDVSQIIFIRVFQKYSQYDEKKGEFVKWLNRLISHCIINILRDEYTKYVRPCILGCTFNLGDDSCGYTESKKQCSECPVYARWKERKEDHYNVAQSLPLENHAQEVSNIQHDTLNIENAKNVIDTKIKQYLNDYEYRVYDLMFIQNKNPKEVGTILQLKTAKNSDVPGYQILRKYKQKFIELAKQIIEDEGLA
jgi:RNA polymerase sigma factor (sigma-70 family)